MRQTAAAILIAAGLSVAMVNGVSANETPPPGLVNPYEFSLGGLKLDAYGSASTDGNLTTAEQTEEVGFGFSARKWRESGLPEYLLRQESFRLDQFTVAASNTRISPVVGLRGTSVKQVVRNALKFRFVWNWEKGKTTIQFTKGSLQTIGLLDDSVYRDDVIRLKQTYRLGPWQTRMGLALGRFDQTDTDAGWRDETLTANFGVAGALGKIPLDSELTLRHRRRAHLDVADSDISTAWKLVTRLNLSNYLWKGEAGRRPWLSVTMGAFGNDPDAVGADSYGTGIEYQIGFRAGQKF